jgi:outer membrane protein assembly factor BamB
MTKVFLPLVVALVISGCASKIEREPPAKLVDFKPSITVKELWSEDVGAKAKGWVGLVPKVHGDSVYAADPEGRVSAYELASGRRQWQVDLDVDVSGAVGASDNLVLIGTREGQVIALDRASGSKLWSATVSSEVLAPAVAGSGIVVAQTVDGKLFGLASADGKRLWVHERTEPALSLRGTDTPVIWQNTVVAGFAAGKLVALNLSDGRLLWETTVAQPRGRNEIERLVDVDASPLVMADAIYAASYQGRLVAINPRSGAVGWTRDISTYTGLASDGTNIYVTDEDGRVLAYDRRTGSSAWKQDALRRRGVVAPVVYKDFVVVADYEGYVHWLARDDGRFVGRNRVGSGPIRAPAVTAADTLLVLSHTGTLAALQSSEN